MTDQTLSASESLPQQSVAIVSGADHFLGLHLASSLVSQGLSVIGIPYCLPSVVPQDSLLLSVLSQSPNFQLLSLSQLQLSSTHSSLSSVPSLWDSSAISQVDHYLHQLTSLPYLPHGADYLFITDLYAASHSPVNLTTDQFFQIQQHLSALITNFSRTHTKTNFVLPYYQLRTESSPFPFHQVDYRHLYHQIQSSGLSDRPANFRISLVADCYGPGLPVSSLLPLPQIIHAFRARQSVQLPLGGQTRLYPVHVADVVAGITKATFSLQSHGREFLFSAPHPITVDSLISHLKRLVSLPVSIRFSFSPPPLSSLISTDHLTTTQKLLRWQPQQDLFTQLARLITQPESSAPSTQVVPDASPAPQTVSPTLFNSPPPSKPGWFSRIPSFPSRLRLPTLAFWPSFPFGRSISTVSVVAIVSILLLLTPISLFGFSVIRSSLMFRQSYHNLRSGEFNQAANQAEFAYRGFRSLNRGLNTAILLKYLPVVGSPFSHVQSQLQLAELSSQVLSQTSLSLTLLQETLRQSLDTNSDSDPRVTLAHARLQLGKTQYLLSLLQAQLPEQLPFYLSPSLEVGEYQKLRQLLPEGKDKISQLLSVLSLYDQAAGFADPQTYLLLLQNNRELRPTGGFIGSFALLTVDQGHLADWKIYDVYQADGQLQGHIEPPLPIRDHLGEANWYLRDANWDPDFPTSSARIQWFLNKELNQSVAGVMAVDVDFINSLVAVLDTVEIPDLQTQVTADNFYETTQHQAQANSFEGSRQKSDYLSSLADAVMFKLRNDRDLDWIKLSTAILQGLEQKHFLLHFNHPDSQLVVKDLGWSGSLAAAGTDRQVLGSTSDTIDDQLLLVESNLGVNKANHYLDRSVQHTIDLTGSDRISETLRIKYTNNSAPDNWLGGDYKNYLRLYLPSGAQIQNILYGPSDTSLVSLDDQSIDTSTEHGLTVFGTLLTVPQQSVRYVHITYTLPQSISDRNQVQYRLRLVKQPGTQADPYQLTIKYPSNFTPTNSSASNLETWKPGNLETNFALTDDHTLTYNTTISKDQSFNISFIKEKIKSL